jgi:hypothetical protein
MDVNDDDLDRLEGALRQFQPRRPRPLRALERPRLRWPGIIAMAAALLLVVAAAFFEASRPSPQRVASVQAPPVQTAPVQATPADVASVEAIPEAGTAALGRLTALVAAHPDDFDEALARGSRVLLPDLATSGGGLEQLGKE